MLQVRVCLEVLPIRLESNLDFKGFSSHLHSRSSTVQACPTPPDPTNRFPLQARDPPAACALLRWLAARNSIKSSTNALRKRVCRQTNGWKTKCNRCADQLGLSISRRVTAVTLPASSTTITEDARSVGSRYQPRFWSASVIMSLEAARDLSITDILRILNEKVDFECARVRTIPMPPPVLAASLEAEVSAPTSIDPSQGAGV